ncbi:MAG: hypothetical protein J0H94_03880 [Rhizobiales bacterium]|nr:hypothetical protein [Hyphomicrobiales bacterium]
MSTEIIVDPPFTQVTLEIVADADWTDSLPPLLLDGAPLDLADRILELYIRPTYDHTVLLKKLTSLGSAGIVVDDAAGGLASIYVERPVIVSDLPVGRWMQFLVLREPVDDPDDIDSFSFREIWRGALVVHPGRT